MVEYSKRITIAFFMLMVTCFSKAQDNSGISGWTAESRKIGDGRYEIIFKLSSTGDWQLYAPNQVLLDVNTTELSFADSNIVQKGNFVLSQSPQKVKSSVFEDRQVEIFRGQVSWKAVI
jgi:hypothetical protein